MSAAANKKQKREHSTSAGAGDLDSGFALARALNHFTGSVADLRKSVEVISNFPEETLRDLNMQIESKKEELAKIKHQHDTVQKDGQIQTEQFLKEHKYEGALAILRQAKMVPVAEDELTSLKQEINSLKTSQQAALEELKKQMKEKAAKSMQAALANSELRHKSEIADLSATNKQQINEVKHLNAIIASLKDEVTQQRNLTREVAQAGNSKQQPVAQYAPVQQQQGYKQ